MVEGWRSRAGRPALPPRPQARAISYTPPSKVTANLGSDQQHQVVAIDAGALRAQQDFGNLPAGQSQHGLGPVGPAQHETGALLRLRRPRAS